MKRVLQVVSCIESGGTETFIMNNYKAIDRNRIQFDFLVFTKSEHPYIKEIENMGGRVFYATTPSIRRIGRFIKIIKKIIKKNGPYVAVHSHVNIANSWVMYAAKKVNVPIRISHSHAVFTSEGRIKGLLRKFQVFLMKKNSTDFLACSAEAGKTLFGETFFFEKGVLIKNGIDVNRFLKGAEKTEKLRQEFNIPDKNNLVLGNITRFDDNKNQKFIIDVFKEILNSYPDAILILGGVNGGKLEETKRKTKELGINNNVRFIGKRNDVADCLKLIDAYIFPSVYEGLGIAIIEAQASGCECFVSTGVPYEADMRIGTMHYYDLTDGAKLWADRIISACQERKQPSSIKIQKCFYDKGFSIDSCIKELMSIYEK